jgi:hypothetical protein
MKRSPAFLLAAVVFGTGSLVAQGAVTGSSVTLFNSGTVLVRRTLPVTLPAGVSTQPLALGLFSPTTLSLLDPGVTLQRVSFDPAWSEDALLRRHIGEKFILRRGSSDVVSATLLALDPERWRLEGVTPNGIVFGRPGQILWGAEQVPPAPLADVTVQSDRARNGLKVMYETGGGSWQASYRIFLGAQGRIEGVAGVNAGTLNLSDVEVQLLAGDIGAQRPVPSPRALENYAMAAKSAVADVATQEAVGEAHLYTLPGKVTFTPGAQLVLPLFEPMAVKGTRLLTVGGAMPYYGGFGQEPDERDVPVAVAYRFDRKLATPFGDLPLPAGSVGIYDTDKAGRVQLIGAGAIDHTAPGEMLTISTGTAFDVKAKRTQTSYSTTREQPTQPNMPTRTIAMVGYRVALQNAKDSAVVIEVREDRGGEWSVVASSVPPEKRSATRTVFTVTVPAKGKVDLTYRLRVIW